MTAADPSGAGAGDVTGEPAGARHGDDRVPDGGGRHGDDRVLDGGARHGDGDRPGAPDLDAAPAGDDRVLDGGARHGDGDRPGAPDLDAAPAGDDRATDGGRAFDARVPDGGRAGDDRARDDIAVLAEERDFLLRSIADLDAEHAAGELDDDDYRSLRDNYTARAADVLRRLESAGGPGAPPGVGPAPGPTDPAEAARPRWRNRAAAVAVILVVAGGAGLAVAATAGERARDAPATGSLPDASTDRITRAQLLVSEGKVLEAVKVYDELLEDDPDNPVALAERGWLISRVDPSLVDKGLATIDRAIAVDPGYAEAHFFRGMILFTSKGDPAAAAASFQAALDAGPPPDLASFIEDARDRARAAASPPG